MRNRRGNLTSSGSSSTGCSGANNNKKLECSSRVYKRTRTKKEKEEEHDGNVDMISHLPDPLLHHIFSFLDIKQAIQTCILSRRWRYFWVSLPTLKFSYMQGRKNTFRDQFMQSRRASNEFMDFVDRVLMFRGNSNIHEFALVTNNSIDDRLNTWILVCIIRNVQQLILETFFPRKFHLYQCLFTCKSLTKLVVNPYSNRVSLSLPDSITLPSLKTLSLNLVTFQGGETGMDHLFSSCPVLESLVIRNCELPCDNINISSPQLQHLVLRNCRTQKDLLDSDPVDIKFKLCAPNLISFYYDNFMSACCDLKNLCSLVKADINVDVSPDLSKEKKAMYAECMVNILREFHNMEDLTLSTSFLEVITRASDLLDSQPMKFCNLRCLKLMGTWRSVDCIHAISYLLKISPNIETLFVEEYYYVRQAATTDLLDMQPTQFCNLRCLKIHAVLSRDYIYAMACLLKICPNTETLSYTVYENFSSDGEMDPYCDEINSDPAIERDYWEAGLSLECLLNNLKCFELCDVTGRINELEFLEILLKNAMQLEKLLIVFETTYSDTNGRHIKFSEKLLTFPRASSSVDILIK